MQIASIRKMVVFFAIAAVVQSSAFAGVDFAQLQLGAELSETRKKFGLPEIRIVRNEWTHYYINGDILTMFRIPDDRVREIFALRVPPALADEPGLRGDATVAPTSTQAKPPSARAKRFWKGVGVVLGVAAMGYLAYETAKGIDNDSVPVILDSDPVVPYGNVTQSRIAAEFTGWDGDTLFELDNGQVWQQESYDYLYKYIYRPKVTIIRESGGYVMHVNGVSKSIKVKRLK